MTKLNKYIAVITGLLLTIVMHGALATLLTPVGLPILTAPFILPRGSCCLRENVK